MNHKRHVELHRLFVEREPVFFMHARCLFVARRIGIQIRADEAQLFDTTFQFRDAVPRILFLILRQLSHAAKAIGMELDDARDDVVHGVRPKILQERSHPVPHSDRPGADELDIDIPVIHKFQMALLGVF